VISASHNPYRDNGIKVFSASGKKLGDDMERKIEEDLSQAGDAEAADKSLGPSRDGGEENGLYRERYITYLAQEVGRDLNLEGMRFALDCANGAASEIAPRLFNQLGAETVVIAASPDGRNINEACGSLHLEGLQQTVKRQGLDLGIAFDGDADRALFVDGSGKIVDGDFAMLILADHLKRRGLLAGDRVVATVMSNLGFELALRERGIELVRAQVGDRYVLEEMLARGAKLGGEQSGHIIFADISLAGDGLITAIEVLRAVRASGQRLEELTAEMKRFPQVLVNVHVRSKPPLESVPAIREAIERLEVEMQGRGRSLIRYSGTENLARVMIEGEDQAKIEDQANRLADVIRKAIG
jgi:phosphoglucosamine mutase